MMANLAQLRALNINKLLSLNQFVSPSLKGSPNALVQVATLMRLEIPPGFEAVEFPERRKLKMFEKVPPMPANLRPRKMMKDLYDMRGPEKVHNKIQYGEFGIQALTGGALRWGHYEVIRLTVNRKMDESKMFAMWRIDGPWKAVTKKGIGHRMGSGKGTIDHYVFPVRANRIIIEMGGQCELKEVKHILTQVAKQMPFKARVVTKQMLTEEEREERRKKQENINPFSFKYCAKNNMLGCRSWTSPYDLEWHGKYR